MWTMLKLAALTSIFVFISIAIPAYINRVPITPDFVQGTNEGIFRGKRDPFLAIRKSKIGRDLLLHAVPLGLFFLLGRPLIPRLAPTVLSIRPFSARVHLHFEFLLVLVQYLSPGHELPPARGAPHQARLHGGQDGNSGADIRRNMVQIRLLVCVFFERGHVRER